MVRDVLTLRRSELRVVRSRSLILAVSWLRILSSERAAAAEGQEPGPEDWGTLKEERTDSSCVRC